MRANPSVGLKAETLVAEHNWHIESIMPQPIGRVTDSGPSRRFSLFQICRSHRKSNWHRRMEDGVTRLQLFNHGLISWKDYMDSTWPWSAEQLHLESKVLNSDDAVRDDT
jgi:hypothetical protein